MNTYNNRPDGLPDTIVSGLPVCKPDLFKLWSLSQKNRIDGPAEKVVEVFFYNAVSDPAQAGNLLWNICSVVLLNREMALLLGQHLMVESLYTAGLAIETVKRFEAEITESAYALGRKLDALLDEAKKQDDEERAREITTGSATGEEHDQAKDQAKDQRTEGAGSGDEETKEAAPGQQILGESSSRSAQD